jgi:hypothetical protein
MSATSQTPTSATPMFILRSIRHPLAHAVRAVELSATQFVDVGTGGAIEPLMSGHTSWALNRYAPSLVLPFDAAHQQTDDIDLSGWSDWVVVPLSIIASFGLPLIAVLSWWNGRRREAMLPALLFLALLGNATPCGVVSGSNDRYQARLVWLAELAAGLVVQALARRKHTGEVGCAVASSPTQHSEGEISDSPPLPGEPSRCSAQILWECCMADTPLASLANVVEKPIDSGSARSLCHPGADA